MTREEYRKLPKLPDGMWLAEMQDMADEVKEMFDRDDADCVPEPDAGRLLKDLKKKASDSMSALREWSDLDFLSYARWACIEEIEKCEMMARGAGEDRIKGKLRSLILTVWEFAINDRIEELGGKVEM